MTSTTTTTTIYHSPIPNASFVLFSFPPTFSASRLLQHSTDEKGESKRPPAPLKSQLIMPGNYDGEEIAARRSISDHGRRLRNILLLLSRKETATQIPDRDRLLMPGASTDLNEKKKGFAASAFKGLGCTTSPAQVYAPSTATAVAAAAVRSSADWQEKRSRSRRKKSKGKEREQQPLPPVRKNQTAAVASVADIWCAPGLGFSGGDASIDCIPPSYQQSQNRGRVVGVEHADRIQRENHYAGRRGVCQEQQLSSLIDSPESPFILPLFGSDLIPASHLHRMPRIRRSPGGLDEIVMFQASLMFGELDLQDRYRDWRLDVDDMSYEELLELGDRIGYVNAGLSEEEIYRCLKKIKRFVFKTSPTYFTTERQKKCCICQEDYEMNDEVGVLDCAHSYHICCLKQWLVIKNACPVCKATVSES